MKIACLIINLLGILFSAITIYAAYFGEVTEKNAYRIIFGIIGIFVTLCAAISLLIIMIARLIIYKNLF